MQAQEGSSGLSKAMQVEGGRAGIGTQAEYPEPAAFTAHLSHTLILWVMQDCCWAVSKFKF